MNVLPEFEDLDSDGLSLTARRVLAEDVQRRVVEAWTRERALILNATKPGYSERFTFDAEQYSLVRRAIHLAMVNFADASGEVLLEDIRAFVQERLGDHPRFPKGRLTNYTRYIKTDLEARGELQRVPGSSPQRLRYR